MKIKRLEIYGYGKWVNQTFDINDHLQLFYGKMSQVNPLSNHLFGRFYLVSQIKDAVKIK